MKRVHWKERTRLLEMHKAGILSEGDLTLPALRALNSCGLDAAVLRTVLPAFEELLSTWPRGEQLAGSWKSDALLGLLRLQVGQRGGHPLHVCHGCCRLQSCCGGRGMLRHRIVRTSYLSKGGRSFLVVHLCGSRRYQLRQPQPCLNTATMHGVLGS